MTAAVPLGAFTPGSEEWRDLRRLRLGGSEVAAVLGLSPFESYFSLWHRKQGFAPPQPDKPEMEWGRRLEPAVAAKFLEEHPGDWHLSPGTYQHPRRRWQIASPDALLSDRLLEVKTSLYGDGWGDPGTDEIPVYYRVQTLWYLDTLDLDTAHVAVLIGGHDYREYTLRMDASAQVDIVELRSAAEEFITSIVNNRKPPIDGSDATYQVLREMHPEITADDVEVDATLAGEYLAAVLACKAAKEDQAMWAGRVLDAMGSARNATVDGVRFAYRMARKTTAGEPGTPYLATDRKRLAQLTHKIIGGTAA